MDDNLKATTTVITYANSKGQPPGTTTVTINTPASLPVAGDINISINATNITNTLQLELLLELMTVDILQNYTLAQ